MDHKSWQRVKEIFDRAVERPVGERGVFLDSACAGEAAIRCEVDRLLRGNAEAGSFLATGPWTLASDPMLGRSPVDDIGVGDRVGDYQLVEQIGRGGFGKVFRAQQEHPLRREVALKVIKRGMDTCEVVARFQAERQALAMMEHPNIASVYDAGATDNGRPFFVMELVRGAAITTYCDERALPLTARLALFGNVCSAVQHAHQKGVIHRDIKPSNVMVAGNNGDATAKVIDFGIAKAIDHRLTDETLTDEWRPIGTLEYMSPEQVSPGVDIDTRSDVYSLGVLLYQLLTGTTPFESKRLRRFPDHEIQRILREEAPPKPSTRLHALPHTSGSHAPIDSEAPTVDVSKSSCGLPPPDTSIDDVARHRGVDAHRLCRQVRGELDWIVMKALEKDRSRRYATANDLAADIERFLENEPVLAGPPSRSYRVRKFTRRHRGFVAAATAIVAILIAASITSTVFGMNARREASLREAADEFFLELTFGSIDIEADGSADTTVQHALDAAAQGVAEIDEPAVEALVRARLGSIYRSLGLFSQAREHLEAARALHVELGEDSEEAAHVMYRLAQVLWEYDEFERARVEATAALAIQRKHLGNDHGRNARVLQLLSDILQRQGEQVEAAQRNLEALEMYRRLPDEQGSADMADCLAARPSHLWAGGAEDPIETMAKALAMMKAALGPEHSRTATLTNHYGRMLGAVGRVREGEQLILEAKAVRERVLPLDHVSHSQSDADLGTLYFREERFVEAEALLRGAFEGYERAFPADNEHPLDCGVLLARAVIDQGEVSRYGEALPYLDRAIDVYDGHPQDHWKAVNTRVTRDYVIGCIDAPKSREEVEQDLLRAVTPASDDDSSKLIAMKASERLARLYARWGWDEKALAQVEEALAGYDAMPGDQWLETLRAEVLQGTLLARLDRRDEAEEVLLGVATVASHLEYLFTLKRTTAEALADLYEDWGRPEDAAIWFERAAAEQAAVEMEH